MSQESWDALQSAAGQGDPSNRYGPVPRQRNTPRWFDLAPVPQKPLPPTTRYTCRRAPEGAASGGRIDDATWDSASWSEPFRTIEDGSVVPLETRLALLWDDQYLYARFRLEDPDPSAVTTEHHAWVFLMDADAELFVEGEDGYYEIGINPLGTIYEVRWTWVDRIVARGDMARLEELFKISDGLYICARPGERLGHMGDLGWDMPGLRRSASRATEGGDRPGGWIADLAIPWLGLRAISPEAEVPPRSGTELRIQAYRAYHDRTDPARVAAMEALWGPGASPFVGWTWSVQGNDNVHNPERWATVELE